MISTLTTTPNLHQYPPRPRYSTQESSPVSDGASGFDRAPSGITPEPAPDLYRANDYALANALWSLVK